MDRKCSNIARTHGHFDTRLTHNRRPPVQYGQPFLRGRGHMARRLFGLMLAAIITTATLAMSADPSAFPPGKTFSFKSKGSTLGQVLDEVAKQTGVVVDRSKAEAERALRIECD